MNEIRTERLILRRFREEDYDDLYECLSQLRDDEFEGYPGITYENGREHLRYRLGSEEFYAIELRDSGKLIGSISCLSRDFDAKEAGYIINRDHQRQGYALEALKAVVEDAFRKGAHRVFAECDPRNESSWRLLEKAGFTREAHFRKNLYFRKDESGKPVWKDTCVYARLNGDDAARETPAKGRIVFLNGVTSSGKTSIVEALQDREDVFFYVVANDLFEEMIGERYIRENYWKYLGEVILIMYQTAKIMSDQGRNVLIDGILVEREGIAPHYARLLEIFQGNPLDVVEVYCPLEICRQRNIARGDRYEEQSEEQAALMARNIRYSLRVDTSVSTPTECAEQIVRTLFPPRD